MIHPLVKIITVDGFLNEDHATQLQNAVCNLQYVNSEFGKEIPEFSPGDTVLVQVKVKEGARERLQAFEGIVIAKRNRGLHSAFTVRKISHNIGVERVFQTYSPVVDSITVKRRGDVRRAKLYYLRNLAGRAARIKEKLPAKKGE